MSDRTKKWIKAALIRAVKTMAQTAVALLSTGAIGILDVDWVAVLSASALAGILSILTSLAGLPEVDMGDGYNPIQQGYNIDKLDELLEDGEVVSYDYDCQNVEAEE